ncbi:PspC domain-containing protein [Dellaglioa sp. P0083]|uniref:PspC domain-containing protein n=1 Tax=Dellaglioa kimchii TaxID=3344667 RepID=UPI0038D4FEB4
MRKLTKSNNRIIAGVVGGIAEFFNWDPTLTRIGYVLLSVLSAAFPGIIVYIICAIVMPNASSNYR